MTQNNLYKLVFRIIFIVTLLKGPEGFLTCEASADQVNASVVDSGKRLFDAIQNNDKEAVIQLLTQKVTPNTFIPELGGPVLGYAVGHNMKEMVGILLSHGADINAKEMNGETPLTIAVDISSSLGDLEVLDTLLSKWEDINNQNRKKALTEAIVRGNRLVVERLLAKGAEVNVRNEEGRMLPMVAIDWVAFNNFDEQELRDREEIVRILLDKGGDVNAKDDEYDTPLGEAVRFNKKELAELLLLKGADANISQWGEVPLRIAAEHNNKEMVELLLSKGANVDDTQQWGVTILMESVGQSKAITELILSKGPKINARDERGRTALMYAVKFEAIQGGKRPDVIGTPDRAEAAGERVEIINLLLSKGADINSKDNVGKTVLIEAAESDSKARNEIVKLLISQGANVSAKSEAGETALSIAQSINNMDLVHLLRQAGAK